MQSIIHFYIYQQWDEVGLVVASILDEGGIGIESSAVPIIIKFIFTYNFEMKLRSGFSSPKNCLDPLKYKDVFRLPW